MEAKQEVLVPVFGRVCLSPSVRPTQRQPARQHSHPAQRHMDNESFPHLLHKVMINRCFWFILLFLFYILLLSIKVLTAQYLYSR